MTKVGTDPNTQSSAFCRRSSCPICPHPGSSLASATNWQLGLGYRLVLGVLVCANGHEDTRPWQRGPSSAGSRSSPPRSRAGGASPGGSEDRGQRGAEHLRRAGEVPSLTCITDPGVSGCLVPGGQPPAPSEGVCLACSHDILFMDARFFTSFSCVTKYLSSLDVVSLV